MQYYMQWKSSQERKKSNNASQNKYINMYRKMENHKQDINKHTISTKPALKVALLNINLS